LEYFVHARYGSHDKTFVLGASGVVRVVNNQDESVLMTHDCQEGDIFRMCQTKDVAIHDWVRLAVDRARHTGSPCIFWLDAERGHDANIIAKVTEYLGEYDCSGLDISIQKPTDAVRTSMDRATHGKDTISATGNVRELALRLALH
jgi:isocitrate dehydrogenase